MGSSPAAGQARPAPDPPAVDREALESAVRDLLGALGEDVRREGIVDTPKRVAKAMAFAVRGYGMSAVAHVESALFHEQGLQDDEATLADARVRRGAGAAARTGEATGRAGDAVAEAAAAEPADPDAHPNHAPARPGVVLIRDVPFFSTDEATLLPFYGVCHVGYVPSGGTIVGLSKVARVAEVFARRVQTPEGLASDVARALQLGASPRGVRVVVAGSQMAPTGPRPVFADAAIGCLAGASSAADGEAGRDAREYRAEFRAMLHAGVGAGEGPPVGLTGLAGQSLISGNAGYERDESPARRAVPAKRRRRDPGSGAGAGDANTASDDGSVDAQKLVLCASCGGAESAGGQSGSASDDVRRRGSDASGSGRSERRGGDATERGSPGMGIPGIPGDAHPRSLSLLLRDSGSRPATPTVGREAGKTQPEASPAESAEAKEALEAKEAPAEAEAPDAAVAAAGRIARALGLDRIMDPARCAAAARAYAGVMAASAQGHAMPLRTPEGGVASGTERASSPAGVRGATCSASETTTTHTFFERDLELATLCEHHLLPFHGAVHVAYAADARTKPLSRAEAQRAVARHGRRFQVQERLTRDIARDVAALTGAPGVMVAVRASHLCMIARGVEKPGSTTVTAAALGAFAEDAERRARFWETLAEQ